MGDRTILTLSAPKLDDQISRETFKYEFVVPDDLPLAPVEIVGIGSFSTVCRSVVNIAGVQQACFAIKKLEGALRPLVVSNGAEGLAVDNSNASDSRTAMRGPDDREQKEQRLRDIVRVAREILILQTLSHPFVLKANRVWTHSFDVYLATPFWKVIWGQSWTGTAGIKRFCLSATCNTLPFSCFRALNICMKKLAWFTGICAPGIF